MQFQFNSTSRRALAILTAAAPVVLDRAASANVYSATPATVFTASSVGFTNITLGANSTTAAATVLERDHGVIAGVVSTSSGSQLYYLTPQQPFPDSSAVATFSLPLTTDKPTTSIVDVSPDGTVLGSQVQVNASSSQTGNDLYTYNSSSYSTNASPTAIPVPASVLGSSAVYTYTSSSYPGQTFSVLSANQASISTSQLYAPAVGTGGIVVGTVARFVGNGNYNSSGSATTSLGNDGFYYNPVTQTSTAIGLTGGVHSAPPLSYQTGITNASWVNDENSVVGAAGLSAIGYATRTTSSGSTFGNDAWLYNPAITAGTVQFGLTGPNYQGTDSSGNTWENSQPLRTNTIGQVAGRSYRFLGSTTVTTTPSNLDLWLYTPPTTFASSTTSLTAATFGSNPTTGTYTLLGLTTQTSPISGLSYINQDPTAAIPGQRFGQITFLTNSGNAAGLSTRYDNTLGTSQGTAAWYFNGSTNVDISPTFPADLVVSGGSVASSNVLTAINNTGMVAGYATRYPSTASGSASIGQDAYVYDSHANGGAGETFPVDPANETNATNYELSYIGALSDTGEAVGYFNTYSGTTSGTVTGSDLFVWNENDGTEVLATYPAAAAGSMQAYVQSFEWGSDGTLYGPNSYTGATSIVAYTQVPEPASLGLLGLGAVGLLGRRRRRAV